MKIKYLVVLFTALLLLSFAGCQTVPASAEKDSLIGTWKDSYGLIQYKFEQGGKMKINALEGAFKGTYKVDNDKITIEYHIVLKDVKDTYTIKLGDNTMYLDDKKFTRKK